MKYFTRCTSIIFLPGFWPHSRIFNLQFFLHSLDYTYVPPGSYLNISSPLLEERINLRVRAAIEALTCQIVFEDSRLHTTTKRYSLLLYLFFAGFPCAYRITERRLDIYKSYGVIHDFFSESRVSYFSA